MPFFLGTSYAPVICSHCPPTYGDGRGIAGLMCRAMIFWVPPQCRVSARLVILRKYTPIDFTIIKSGAMTLSRSPQYRAFSRAVMDEKSLSLLFPGWGGGVGGSEYKWLVHYPKLSWTSWGQHSLASLSYLWKGILPPTMVFWFDFCFIYLQHILGHFGCGQLP